MSKVSRAIDRPILTQLSTGVDDGALPSNDKRYGGTLICAADNLIRLFRIDTTQFDSEKAVNPILPKMPDAGDTEAGIVLTLTDKDAGADVPSGQVPVPGDRAGAAHPGVPPHTEQTLLGSKDLELIQALRHMRDGCATAEEQEAWGDFCKIEGR